MQKKDKVCSIVEEMLHEQRHDFLNNLQVVHGYLQLGKIEKALEYLEKTAEDKRSIERLLDKYQCPINQGQSEYKEDVKSKE